MADEMTPTPNLIQQYAKSVQERKLEAEAQMQKLMKALDSRRNLPFDPMLMRVAGALLQPTKTGGAGESIGYAATAAADEAQRQALQNTELAKMEFELSQKQQAQKSAMDQQNFAMQYFASKRPPVAPVAKNLTTAQPAINPITKEPPSSDQMPEGMPQAAPQVTQAPVSQAAPPVDQASQVTEQYEVDPLLAVLDPNLYKIEMELRDELRKAAEDRRREAQLVLNRRDLDVKERMDLVAGGVKIAIPQADFNKMADLIKEGNYEALKPYYTRHNLDFPFKKDKDGWRRKTASEAEREKAVAAELGQVDRGWKGGTYKLDSFQAAEHDQARKEGTLSDFWNKYFIEQGGGTVPSTGSAKTDAAKVDKILSVEQKDIKKASEVKSAETNITAQAKRSEELSAAVDSSGEQYRAATTILDLLNDDTFSGAQGYFAQPGVKNAFVNFLKDGIRLGNYSLGVPALADSLQQVGMTPEEAAAKATILQRSGELRMQLAAMLKGSVSNFEQVLLGNISGSIDTPLTSMKAAMSTIQAKAIFDEKNQKAFETWREKNPYASPGKYTASDEYRSVKKGYLDQVVKINNFYFPKSKVNVSSPAANPATKPNNKSGSKFLQ